MSRYLQLIATLGLILCSFLNVNEVVADDWDDCISESGDVSIAGCGSIIASSQTSKSNLAIAHYNRGNSYFAKSRFEKAIEDYTQAILYNPQYANAYSNRALSYLNSSKLDLAEQDFKKLLEIGGSSSKKFAEAGLQKIGRERANATPPQKEEESQEVSAGSSQSADNSSPNTEGEDPNPTNPTISPLKMVENIDLVGDLVGREDATSATACATICEGNDQCKAFSFNKWNDVCFLKAGVVLSFLEPSMISGYRISEPPPSASGRPVIGRYRGKVFPGDGYKSSFASDFSACEARCLSDRKCLAFSFLKAEKLCKLFNSAPEYVRQSDVDSGVKHQLP